MTTILQQYKSELEHQLKEILNWWMQHAPDQGHGGFHGSIDNGNNVAEPAPRGSVLVSRILYTFAAAYKWHANPAYLQMADRAYQYLAGHFVDKQHGGVYWTIDQQGQPIETKKQVYAQAFALYGLSEYYTVAPHETVKQLAFDLCNQLQKHAHDTRGGGYVEALNQSWQPMDDLRLSAKDENAPKTMNTHLHVLEAYTNVYRVWPNQLVKQNIVELLQLFLTYIIDPLTNHLTLFFDNSWSPQSGIISYGHDIEAAWLLLEAAEVVQDDALINMVKYRSQKLAQAAERGLDHDGGLWYEKDIAANQLIHEKHWWPQAEAMVGFFNTWQITGDERNLQHSLQSWAFVKNNLLDTRHGEWFWGVTGDGQVMQGQDKAGLWKCPYHNGRACLEIIKRINKLN